MSLCYQPAANRLTVVVLKARNLPKMDITGLSGTYCKKEMENTFGQIHEIKVRIYKIAPIKHTAKQYTLKD